MILTAQYLRSILSYDPATGAWTWLKRSDVSQRWNTRNAGKPAGGINKGKGGGYLIIRIFKKHYRAHRLAWLYMTGEWPKEEIDHKNTDRSDCTWDNIRPATSSQNKANSQVRSDNTSGMKGVGWHKRDRKWRAYISVDGKQKSLGHFNTAEDASAAYAQAAKHHFGEFART